MITVEYLGSKINEPEIVHTTLNQFTQNVIDNFRDEISSAYSMDTINKLYRQARIWVRFQKNYAGAFSGEDARCVNLQLKNIRWDRMEQLGIEFSKEENK